MPELPEIVFADYPETILRKQAKKSAKKQNHVLLGTLLEVQGEAGSDSEWYEVKTRRAGKGGFVQKDHVSETAPLKMFFVDVGQGDGTLIESPQGVVIVDGGQGENFYRFLVDRYKPLFDRGQRVKVEAMILSHPDADHYAGLKKILVDKKRFEVGRIYHNGIMRYKSSIENSRKKMLAAKFLKKIKIDGEDAFLLQNIFSTLGQAKGKRDEMAPLFRGFWDAVNKAHDRRDLESAKRLVVGSLVKGFEEKGPGKLSIEVLGPVPHPGSGVRYLALEEPPEREDKTQPPPHSFGYSHSHTRNGHSIVLRMEFGKHSFLLGGDLNIPAEQLLMKHHGGSNPFRVDVAKACHHGSSDFSPDFLQRVSPHATVISSGDNKSFDHPMADTLGSLARHSRGTLPLLFSTEIGRAVSIDKKTGKIKGIHFGLTNIRSNGKTLTMAQMKEQHDKTDVWDSYTVPYPGKFFF